MSLEPDKNIIFTAMIDSLVKSETSGLRFQGGRIAGVSSTRSPRMPDFRTQHLPIPGQCLYAGSFSILSPNGDDIVTGDIFFRGNSGGGLPEAENAHFFSVSPTKQSAQWCIRSARQSRDQTVP